MCLLARSRLFGFLIWRRQTFVRPANARIIRVAVPQIENIHTNIRGFANTLFLGGFELGGRNDQTPSHHWLALLLRVYFKVIDGPWESSFILATVKIPD
jgi:hypothetical protein